MLHALLRRKRPRGAVPDPGSSDDASPIDADLLSGREDPLTATVFERVAYLPDRVAWTLLQASSVPLDGSEPLRGAAPAASPTWTFWPALRPGVGSRNSVRVEPDVVAGWGDEVLLFEAKHHGEQWTGQWLDQIRAVRADRRWRDRRLLFFAVGGRAPGADAERSAVVHEALGASVPPMFRIQWEVLHVEVERLLGADDHPPERVALLRDIAAGLDLWGYRLRPQMATFSDGTAQWPGSFERSAGTLAAWRTP